MPCLAERDDSCWALGTISRFATTTTSGGVKETGAAQTETQPDKEVIGERRKGVFERWVS